MGSVNLDIPYFSLFLLFYEKNMQNIDVTIHVKLELQEIGC